MFIIVIIFVIMTSCKAQNEFDKILKKTEFYQSISFMPYWNRAKVTGISEKINIRSRNIGMHISYSVGALYKKTFSINGGFFFAADPFNYNITFEEKDFGLGFGQFFDRPIVYNFSTGLVLKTEYYKKLSLDINLKTGLGINLKYFLFGGVNRGSNYVINDSTDLRIYAINLPVKNISEKGFLNYTVNIGITKQLKKSNSQFFVELTGNISHENITEGTIDFFVGEPYEENGTYIQKGHFIGLNTGFIFFGG